jgi:hypothetical protein
MTLPRRVDPRYARRPVDFRFEVVSFIPFHPFVAEQFGLLRIYFAAYCHVYTRTCTHTQTYTRALYENFWRICSALKPSEAWQRQD